MTDLNTGKDRPPKPEEWPGIWAALDKADKGWLITGPFYALVKNWKALSAVLAIILWFNSGALVEILWAVVNSVSGVAP